MLRYALRRALWAIPTLFGVSLIVFFVTTLIPDPAARANLSSIAAHADPNAVLSLEERRRTHFLDLPSFFNPTPKDVATRAQAALEHIVLDDA